MDEENLEVSVIDNPGECDSIVELDESTVMVGGERGEATSVEDETVEVGGGMVKVPAAVAEDGGGEVIASEPREEGANRVDCAERVAVAADGVNTPIYDVVNKEGDELVIDSEFEIKKDEEIVGVLDAKLEVDVTHSEPHLDAGGVEIAEDTQIEVKGEEEFRPVADTDAGCEQHLSELQTDVAGGELNPVMEGTDSLNNAHKRELGEKEDVAALGGVENVSVERMTVDNYAEIAARSDDVAEERGDLLVNDSEFGGGEKPTEVEEEKGDAEAMAEIPATEVETDGSVHLGNVSEQEQIHESNEDLEDLTDHERSEHVEDKEVAAEESQISETKMVDDDDFSMKVSSDAKINEHLNKSEYKEDADLPAGDIKQEEESRVESEMTRNSEVDHLYRDAEIDTEMGTNSIDSKTPDDDGKMETEDTMSDVDEATQDMYDSPGGLQDEEDETIAAEEETGMQDTEMETETDMAESGKSSGGKRKRAKLTKSSSITRAMAKGSSRKTVGEDVCFICFDGGELVLCDRRGCPKAYHPSCVNRDEAFFKSKGRWNCGTCFSVSQKVHAHV